MLSRDARLVEAAQAAAAAAGVELSVVHEPGQMRARWRAAPVVLVGADLAALAAAVPVDAVQGERYPDMSSIDA